MTAINDDDLILYLLDEVSDSERQRIESAIANDPVLAARKGSLADTLTASDHWQYEADTGLEQRIWNRVDAGLTSRQESSEQPSPSSFDTILGWFQRPAFVFSAVAVAIAMAFFSGRLVEHQEMMDNPEQMIASLDDEARQNILVQSVSLHLERTSRLMTSVKVSDQPNLVADEQEWAQRLLTSNRVFKVAARQAQQWRIVTLLEELEPLLIEMANPESVDLITRNQITQRIDDNGLVFKTRNFASVAQPAI